MTDFNRVVQAVDVATALIGDIKKAMADLVALKASTGADAEAVTVAVAALDVQIAEFAAILRDTVPAHQWEGTALSLKRPDGTWGPYVDLAGEAATLEITGVDMLEPGSEPTVTSEGTATDAKFRLGLPTADITPAAEAALEAIATIRGAVDTAAVQVAEDRVAAGEAAEAAAFLVTAEGLTPVLAEVAAQDGNPIHTAVLGRVTSQLVEGLGFTKTADLPAYIAENIETAWEKVTETPTTLEGYGITDVIKKDAATFDVLSYIRAIDPASAAAVEAGSLTGQDGDKVLEAVRAAGDDMLAFVQGRSFGCAVLLFPAGTVGLKDELFSDEFQSAYWLQTGLGKGKHMIVRGMGADLTTIEVRSDYVSAARNSFHANERNYGPWAGAPSPSILIPIMANKNIVTPSAMSVQHLRLRGSSLLGTDPIAMLVNNELDARHTDLHVTGFDNHGDVIMGSYNCIRTALHFEANAAQPVQGGSIMGYPAGFHPSWVWFDLTTSAGVITATAKAREARGGYAVGDAVPWFDPAHVGKTMAFHAAASHTGLQQVAKMTISSVPGAASSTAVVVFAAGVTSAGASLTSRAGSFFPVKVSTTADSASVTLSDPVLAGSGQADMVGQIVMIPKAGSKADTTRDLFCARIVSCDVGNDVAGYTQVTLSSQARFTISGEDFIWSAGHSTAIDELLAATYSNWGINDTDFVQCRWEQSGGYVDDRSTGSYQFVSQGVSGAVQYVACKAHGANTDRGQFAADGQAIIDAASGLHFFGLDFTHMALHGKGQVRLMGSANSVQMTNSELGSWQLPHDFVALYADPQTGYSEASWGIECLAPRVDNARFPTLSQALLGGKTGLSTTTLRRVFSSPLNRGGANITVLAAADDLNNVKTSGLYRWDTAPSNAWSFAGFSTMVANFDNAGIIGTQIGWDADNHSEWVRDLFSGTWSPWRPRDAIVTATTTQLADITHVINTGKFQGRLVLNTDNGDLYVARATGAAAAWKYFSGTTVTPA